MPKDKDKGSSTTTKDKAAPAAAPPPQIATVDEKGAVVAVAYPDLSLLNQGLCRVSWYSENKVLKGKYLNLAQWEALPKSSGLSPVGHNFPSAILLKWLQLAPADDWNPIEKMLFDALIARRFLANRKGVWSCTFTYLIAGVFDAHETFRHELMHAFYFAYEPYRQLVSQTLLALPTHLQQHVTTYMKSKGYDADVLEDEFQAYLCTEDYSVVGGNKAGETKAVVAVIEQLRQCQRENSNWGDGWRELMLEGKDLEVFAGGGGGGSSSSKSSSEEHTTTQKGTSTTKSGKKR